MPFVPSWVHGTDVLAAIEGGTRAGQASRAQADATAGRNADRAQSGQEARARLKLAYDSLLQQQGSERQRMAAQREQNMAANALRAQQSQAMAQYRSQQQQFEQAKLKDAEAKQAAAEALKMHADESTKGFFSSLQSGKDPLQALEENPGVPPQVAHPLISGHLASLTEDKRERARQDAATALQHHQDTMLNTRETAIDARETQREQARQDAAEKKQTAAEALQSKKDSEQTLTFDEEIPKEDAVPATPFKKGWIWDTPADPGKLGHPAYKLHRRVVVPDGTDPASVLRGTGPAPSVKAGTVKPGDIITGPDGKKHRVTKAGDLPEGFTMGQ